VRRPSLPKVSRMDESSSEPVNCCLSQAEHSGRANSLALRRAVGAAVRTGRPVVIPAGSYKIDVTPSGPNN
jgi:hypothetical protein